MGETWKRNRFYTVSNYLPKKYALVMNGAKATFTAEKAGRPFLSDQSHPHE